MAAAFFLTPAETCLIEVCSLGEALGRRLVSWASQ